MCPNLNSSLKFLENIAQCKQILRLYSKMSFQHIHYKQYYLVPWYILLHKIDRSPNHKTHKEPLQAHWKPLNILKQYSKLLLITFVYFPTHWTLSKFVT